MKVIFLDYDGVLNRIDIKNDHFTPQVTINGVSTQADQELVYRLNVLVDRTGAELVLSSSWRMYPDWRKCMGHSGIVKEFYGKTPVLSLNRGGEIQLWLDEHPSVEKYAIIDDNSDMLEFQLPNFFKTDMASGLTQEIADAIEKHLL